MAINSVKVTITEGIVEVATSPLDPTGLTATGLRQKVLFTWDAMDMYAYFWQYRVQVGADGWGAWTRVDGNSVIRELTATERSTYGFNANIQIQLRSTNGVDYSIATPAANANCILGGYSDNDIAVAKFTPAALDATTLARMFTTAARNADEITDSGGKYLAVTALADQTLGATSADTTLVNGVAAATISTGAANGTIAQTKLAAEVGANTIDTTVGSQTKVDTRLSSAEKSNLEAVLGTTLAGLDTAAPADVILVASGTNKNLAANLVTIKTDLLLNNVENKSSATIRGEIVDGDIPAGITRSNVIIAALNASAEGINIQQKIDSFWLRDSATGLVAVHNVLGYNTVGIDNAGSLISAATIDAVIDNATQYAVRLNLGGTLLGSLDDIPETGVDFTVTANEKLGALYAHTGLNATGRQKVGIYDGVANYSVTDLSNRITGSRVLWSAYNDVVLGITDMAVVTIAGTGLLTWIPFRGVQVVKCAGDIKFKFNAALKSTASTGNIRLQIQNIAMGVVATGTPVTIASAAYSDTYECEVTVPSTADGTLYIVTVEVDDVAARLIDIKGGVLYATMA